MLRSEHIRNLGQEKFSLHEIYRAKQLVLSIPVTLQLNKPPHLCLSSRHLGTEKSQLRPGYLRVVLSTVLGYSKSFDNGALCALGGSISPLRKYMRTKDAWIEPQQEF